MRTRWSPPVVDPGRLAELAAEIERIGELIRHDDGAGGPGEAEAAMVAFRARTGHDYTIADFADYHGSRSLADFALEAARPARPRIADITRAELVEIVERILAGDAELDWYLLVLTVNVAHPRVTELIFGGPAGGDGTLESAEEIVVAASAYRAIAL
ncbi:hypothetical protein [Streptomyces sp. SID3343]|uniref:hypothetical protein n=1 Tax=Streptomyces sp. SID3343 TaxID=2690260 RepID=UPI00137144E4|nr:hypothetical protein [Streptomyces sp. SID3343]MYV97079.1 hypothetical protein [Streptomyces sp. SID3343]